MITIPDLGQAHEKYGEVKLVKWVPNPPPKCGKRKISNKTNRSNRRINYKNQTESHQI